MSGRATKLDMTIEANLMIPVDLHSVNKGTYILIRHAVHFVIQSQVKQASSSWRETERATHEAY